MAPRALPQMAIRAKMRTGKKTSRFIVEVRWIKRKFREEWITRGRVDKVQIVKSIILLLRFGNLVPQSLVTIK